MLRNQRRQGPAQPTVTTLELQPALCTIEEDELLPVTDAATVQVMHLVNSP